MAVNVLKNKIDWIEDFTSTVDSTDLVVGRCIYTAGGGGTLTNVGINGGMVRMTLAGDDGDVVSLFGPLAFEPDESIEIGMQVTFRTSDASTSSIFIGFTDARTDTVVIEDEDGTLNTVPNDAFGVLLEGEQDGTWQTVGVQNTTDNAQAALTNTTAIPDLADNTWTTVKIVADAQNSGRMKVWVDGVAVVTANTNTENWTESFLRSSIIYAPVISADDRGTAVTVDILEMAWFGNLGTIGPAA